MHITFYALYSMHCILWIVSYVFYSMHCISCIVFYALYSMHCILCMVFYALNYMHCNFINFILSIVFYALYSMHWILNIVFNAFDSIHCFLWFHVDHSLRSQQRSMDFIDVEFNQWPIFVRCSYLLFIMPVTLSYTCMGMNKNTRMKIWNSLYNKIYIHICIIRYTYICV